MLNPHGLSTQESTLQRKVQQEGIDNASSIAYKLPAGSVRDRVLMQECSQLLPQLASTENGPLLGSISVFSEVEISKSPQETLHCKNTK